MKKILVITLLFMFAFCGIASARVKYDKSGHIIYDNTIRGQKRAQKAKQFQGAAAARIDYNSSETGLKSNYKYNNAVTTKSNLKSNYKKFD